MARITSVQVGLPRDLGDANASDPMDQPWRSAFFKKPVAGPVSVETCSIVGDGVADRAAHGGTDKAVLAYALSHYELWKGELGIDAVDLGAFGENLTIDGLDESTVCIGDIWEAGCVSFEVSQPRQPCWKLGRRWRNKEVPARVTQTGRSGWYLRVKRIGTIEAGIEIKLIDRPHPKFTVTLLNDMLYRRATITQEALDCPALAQAWRVALEKKRAK
jgi:MOSC domain-containing protein YiiM